MKTTMTEIEKLRSDNIGLTHLVEDYRVKIEQLESELKFVRRCLNRSAISSSEANSLREQAEFDPTQGDHL